MSIFTPYTGPLLLTPPQRPRPTLNLDTFFQAMNDIGHTPEALRTHFHLTTGELEAWLDHPRTQEYLQDRARELKQKITQYAQEAQAYLLTPVDRPPPPPPH